MERGILLESNGRQAVVLTPQGEFLRIAADRNWQVGDEVSFQRGSVPAPRRTWWTNAAAIAAVIALALGVTFYSGVGVEAAVATVTVDINPSVQLDVSGRGNVVAAQALNADGQRVLHDLRYRRRPVEDVVADMADLAVKEGFLDPADKDSLVMISAQATAGNALPPKLVARLQEQAEAKALARLKVRNKGAEPQTHIVTMAADANVRELAARAHISPNKAAVIEYLEEQGDKVDPAQVGDKSVKDLLRDAARKAGLPPGELIDRFEHQSKEPAGHAAEGQQKGERPQGKGDEPKKAGDDKGKPAEQNRAGGKGTSTGGAVYIGPGDRGGPAPGNRGDGKGDGQGDRNGDGQGDGRGNRNGDGQGDGRGNRNGDGQGDGQGDRGRGRDKP